MFYYAAFVAIVLLIVRSNGNPTRLKRNEPTRCCIPDKFSAQISTSSGMQLPDDKTFGTYGYYNFSYDVDRGMVGMKGVSFSVPEQKKSNIWIIENINDGQIYTIDLDSKQCYKSTMPIKLLRCIPDSATYLHSVSYGYGNKQIPADTWLVIMDDFITYTTVSSDGLCVPLSGHSFLAQPPLVTAVTTTDFEPNVDDPSIFDIPAECKNAV
ncbi:unnamed protein product [Rotaria sp. Silwood1]|nr:unnamed protein product [Rotaria sp. Silwood1]CAF0785042.1 unnamed protein product [Rotaria sp. Silwood1]CAF3322764.1 unnamed protein product [Rotaria sp. Silwood1]CAF3342973.1 unnamed protein product [Rotaria sp. Silwood1]CAF3346094.1 unnamed protein product [Rotaria sp. Silwood1]